MNSRKTFANHMLVGACVVGFLTWALADYWPLDIETPFNNYRKLRGFSIGEELAFVPQVIAVMVLGIGGLVASVFVSVMFVNKFVRGRERFYHRYYNKLVALLTPLALMWTGFLLHEVYLNGSSMRSIPVLILAGASVLVTVAGVISNLVNPEAKWFGRQTDADPAH